MRQKIILFFLSMGIIIFCFSCKPSEKSIKLQQTYIPSAISGVYIGMPMKAFKENRGMENMSLSYKGNVKILKEEFAKDSIMLMQYHFAKNKLCKIIIDYSDSCKVYDMYKEKLGEPNSSKAWLINIDKKLKLLIWTQQQVLCISDSKKYKY